MSSGVQNVTFWKFKCYKDDYQTQWENLIFDTPTTQKWPNRSPIENSLYFCIRSTDRHEILHEYADCDSAINKGQVVYFFIAHAQNGHISPFCKKNRTSPSCSLTQIFHTMQEFWYSAINKGRIAYFFIGHARNTYISTSGQKSDFTIMSPTLIFYEIKEFGDSATSKGQIPYFFIAQLSG